MKSTKQILAAAAALAFTAGTASAAIVIDSFQAALGSGGGGDKTLLTGFSSSSDKLVVVLGGEHGFPNNTGGNFNSVTLNGVSFTEAAQEGSGIPTVAIFYLDNPGAAGTGDLVVNQANHNGSIWAMYEISGSAPGIGATGIDTDESVGITTTGSDSLVIAGYLNAGPNGGNGAGNVDAVAPLVEDTPYLEQGNTWVSLSSGHAYVASPGANTFSWTVDDVNDLTATAAVEILVPEPGSLALLGLGGLVVARRRRA